MSQRHPTLEVLAIPAARAFVAGRSCAAFASTVVMATLSYHLFAVTGSYALLGALGLVEFLPVVPVSLAAGLAADRRERRGLLQLAYGASLAIALGMATVTQGREGDEPFVFAGALAFAVARGFAAPVGGTLLPNLVPRDLFQNAIVFQASLRNLSMIAGPIAMGLVVARLGFAAPYALAAGAYALAIVAFSRVPRIPPPDAPASGAPSGLAIREGLRFVLGNRPLFSSMALDMVAVVFASVVALLPVYADEILRVGPEGYGLLRAGMGIGTFTMTLVLLTRRPFEEPGRALLWAVGFFGLATLAFGLSPSFGVSMFALVVAGMADQISMTTRSVITQLSTPDALRGRVNAVSMIFIGASNELGDAESGFLASLTSATFTVVAGGLACLATVASVAWRVPELRRYRPAASVPPSNGEPSSPREPSRAARTAASHSLRPHE